MAAVSLRTSASAIDGPKNTIVFIGARVFSVKDEIPSAIIRGILPCLGLMRLLDQLEIFPLREEIAAKDLLRFTLDLLQRPMSQTCSTAMRKIKRPDLRSRHNDAHNGNSHFSSRDVNDNDLVKT